MADLKRKLSKLPSKIDVLSGTSIQASDIFEMSLSGTPESAFLGGSGVSGNFSTDGWGSAKITLAELASTFKNNNDLFGYFGPTNLTNGGLVSAGTTVTGGTYFLNGNGNFEMPASSYFSSTNLTGYVCSNTSTYNDGTYFLNGNGNWSIPTNSDVDLSAYVQIWNDDIIIDLTGTTNTWSYITGVVESIEPKLLASNKNIIYHFTSEGPYDLNSESIDIAYMGKPFLNASKIILSGNVSGGGTGYTTIYSDNYANGIYQPGLNEPTYDVAIININNMNIPVELHDLFLSGTIVDDTPISGTTYGIRSTNSNFLTKDLTIYKTTFGLVLYNSNFKAEGNLSACSTATPIYAANSSDIYFPYESGKYITLKGGDYPNFNYFDDPTSGYITTLVFLTHNCNFITNANILIQNTDNSSETRLPHALLNITRSSACRFTATDEYENYDISGQAGAGAFADFNSYLFLIDTKIDVGTDNLYTTPAGIYNRFLSNVSVYGDRTAIITVDPTGYKIMNRGGSTTHIDATAATLTTELLAGWCSPEFNDMTNMASGWIGDFTTSQASNIPI